MDMLNKFVLFALLLIGCRASDEPLEQCKTFIMEQIGKEYEGKSQEESLTKELEDKDDLFELLKSLEGKMDSLNGKIKEALNEEIGSDVVDGVEITEDDGKYDVIVTFNTNVNVALGEKLIMDAITGTIESGKDFDQDVKDKEDLLKNIIDDEEKQKPELERQIKEALNAMEDVSLVGRYDVEIEEKDGKYNVIATFKANEKVEKCKKLIMEQIKDEYKGKSEQDSLETVVQDQDGLLKENECKIGLFATQIEDALNKEIGSDIVKSVEIKNGDGEDDKYNVIVTFNANVNVALCEKLIMKQIGDEYKGKSDETPWTKDLEDKEGLFALLESLDKMDSLNDKVKEALNEEIGSDVVDGVEMTEDDGKYNVDVTFNANVNVALCKKFIMNAINDQIVKEGGQEQNVDKVVTDHAESCDDVDLDALNVRVKEAMKKVIDASVGTYDEVEVTKPNGDYKVVAKFTANNVEKCAKAIMDQITGNINEIEIDEKKEKQEFDAVAVISDDKCNDVDDMDALNEAVEKAMNAIDTSKGTFEGVDITKKGEEYDKYNVVATFKANEMEKCVKAIIKAIKDEDKFTFDAPEAINDVFEVAKDSCKDVDAESKELNDKVKDALNAEISSSKGTGTYDVVEITNNGDDKYNVEATFTKANVNVEQCKEAIMKAIDGKIKIEAPETINDVFEVAKDSCNDVIDESIELNGKVKEALNEKISSSKGTYDDVKIKKEGVKYRVSATFKRKPSTEEEKSVEAAIKELKSFSLELVPDTIWTWSESTDEADKLSFTVSVDHSVTNVPNEADMTADMESQFKKAFETHFEEKFDELFDAKNVIVTVERISPESRRRLLQTVQYKVTVSYLKSESHSVQSSEDSNRMQSSKTQGVRTDADKKFNVDMVNMDAPKNRSKSEMTENSSIHWENLVIAGGVFLCLCICAGCVARFYWPSGNNDDNNNHALAATPPVAMHARDSTGNISQNVRHRTQHTNEVIP